MSEVGCLFCTQRIPIPPRMPLTFKINDEGKQVIEVDCGPLYEHMKTHPEAWTSELEKEYEEWKAQRKTI